MEALLLPAPVGGSGCTLTVAGGVLDLDAIAKIVNTLNVHKSS